MKHKSAFIDPDYTVTVRDGENNWMTLKGRMDMATRAKLQSEITQFSMSISDVGSGKNPDEIKSSFSTEAQRLALLRLNLVSWGGPLFTQVKTRKVAGEVVEEIVPVPCTPEYINRLAPGLEIVDLALEKLDELNMDSVDETVAPEPKETPENFTNGSAGPISEA